MANPYTSVMGDASFQGPTFEASLQQVAQQQTPPYHIHTPTQGLTPQSVPSHHQGAPAAQQHRQPHATSSTPQQQAKSVKRPRPVKSCLECRKRKLKCDRLCPCSQCQKSARGCKYTADNDSGNLSDGSDGEGGSVRSAKKLCSFAPPGVMAQEVLPGYVRSSEVPGVSILEELAGRMERIEKHIVETGPADTEREFVQSGPRPLDADPKTCRVLSVKPGGLLLQRGRLHGSASPRVMLNLFDEAKAFLKDHAKDPEARDILTSFRKMHRLLQDEYQKSLKPITVFVDSMMPVQKRMQDILPKKAACDRLVSSYLATCETLFRVVHTPTFTKQYNQFWEGTLQSDYFLPQLLAVSAIASRFETKSRGLGHERVEGTHIPTACALIRIWLNELRGKQQTELPTLQVELLLVLTQRMIKAHTRDGWMQMSSIVRIAQSMGLHRDPDEFEGKLDPFNSEMRRRLWYTVADLDLFISTDCNMPGMIREGEWTTKPPRNLDDHDLRPDMKELPLGKPMDELTNTHIQAYSAMSLPLRLRAGGLLNRIDTLREYSEILEVTSRMERILDEINYVFPRHAVVTDAHMTHRSQIWRTRVVLDMNIRRPLIALYRPFALGGPDVPSVLSSGYLKSSIAMVYYVEELDPMMPDFRDTLDACHISLKGDIIQAAMGICHYIRNAVRATGTTDTPTDKLKPETPESIPSLCAAEGDEPMVWSIPRLNHIVDISLDFLIQNIKKSDTKDIICLSVVAESVKRANPSQEEMAHGLRLVMDRCLRAANFGLEKLASAPPDLYGEGQGYIAPRQPVRVQHGELDGWDFWDGWE